MARFMAALMERWPQWYAMVFTQFATASRFSEVSALRWEDVDWDRGIVRMGSGSRQADSGWVFPSPSGNLHHNSSCRRKAFVDCLKEIWVDRRFSSHGLRRTANDLIRRVAGGEVARAITGHVTVAMTDQYAHVDTAEKKAAVEGMLRLIQGDSAEGPSDGSRTGS